MTGPKVSFDSGMMVARQQVRLPQPRQMSCGSRGRVVMFSDQARKLADQAARLRAEVEELEKLVPKKPVTAEVCSQAFSTQ